jgi:hypothetical protein
MAAWWARREGTDRQGEEQRARGGLVMGEEEGAPWGVLLFVRGKLGLVALSPCVLLPYAVCRKKEGEEREKRKKEKEGKRRKRKKVKIF